MLRYFYIKLLLIAVIIPTHSHAKTDHAKDFQTFLESQTLKSLNKTPVYKDDLLKFYELRAYKPVWYNQENTETRNMDDIQNIIAQQAHINGLDPQEYFFEEILKSNISGNNMFEREWMLTNTIMHYINDIRTGRIKPHSYDSKIFLLPQKRALNIHVAKLLEAKDMEEYLESLVPPHLEYAQLRDKLAQYRDIVENGGWQSVDFEGLLYPGESNKAVPQIRARLEAAFHEYDGRMPDNIWIDDAQLSAEEISDRVVHQNLATDSEDKKLAAENASYAYDGKLAKKVAEFQYFHGKKADGVVGPQTIKALNTTLDQHIDKIKLAMERWRWLPDDLGNKHVRVNIAAFYVRAVKNKQDQFVMPVIVGKVAHQTPVFSSVIKNVKIHPDWTSPDSIANRYVIPKIKKNPSVIYKLGYQAINKRNGQVVPWEGLTLASLNTQDLRFRQKPGNKNALGLARFSIENNYAIFMHGTPDETLFNEDDRTYSSGCIRLEDPLKMAHFLLNDEGMSRKELEDLYLLNDGEFPDTTYVDLKNDVPVHLMYMTAWMDQQGNLHFADDVYGRDKKLKSALETIK